MGWIELIFYGLFSLVLLVGLLIGLYVLTHLVPWFKYAVVYFYTGVLVYSIEQQYGSGSGPDKKDEVWRALKERFGTKIQDVDYNHIIESWVGKLHERRMNGLYLIDSQLSEVEKDDSSAS